MRRTSGRSAGVQEILRGDEDSAQHWAGQLAGEGVLLGGVICGDERDPLPRGVMEPWEKTGLVGAEGRRALAGAEVGFPADAAEADPTFTRSSRRSSSAGTDAPGSRRQRFVAAGRSDRGGDVGVVQLETVGGVDRRGWFSNPRGGGRERATPLRSPLNMRPVRYHRSPPAPPPQSRGARVAEAGQRPRPVPLADVPPWRRRGGGFSMGDESRAAATANDARVEPLEERRALQGGRIVTR